MTAHCTYCRYCHLNMIWEWRPQGQRDSQHTWEFYIVGCLGHLRAGIVIGNIVPAVFQLGENIVKQAKHRRYIHYSTWVNHDGRIPQSCPLMCRTVSTLSQCFELEK